MFLSTPPSRVATRRPRSPSAPGTCFYPRHPRGWRLLLFLSRLLGQDVSIHATLAGGDLIELVASVVILVSIHATLAGGDPTTEPKASYKKSFYPRHPRGWRREHCKPECVILVFLSTPPSRVATRIPVKLSPQEMFLSTPPSRVATVVRRD